MTSALQFNAYVCNAKYGPWYLESGAGLFHMIAEKRLPRLPIKSKSAINFPIYNDLYVVYFKKWSEWHVLCSKRGSLNWLYWPEETI